MTKDTSDQLDDLLWPHPFKDGSKPLQVAADEGTEPWASQLDVSCTLLALNTRHDKGIVSGSFNAG